jgi:hypothetical protein
VTALTALALVAAGVALTGAPDGRARLLGVVLGLVAGYVVARRWDAWKGTGRVDRDGGVAADRVGAGVGSSAAGGGR